MNYPQTLYTEPFTAMAYKMPPNRLSAVLSLSLWLLNVIGSLWAKFVGFTDWSLFGWAFAGSTVFVIWEMTQPTPVIRSSLQRIGMVGSGLLVSLATNTWISEKFDMPIVAATFILGAAGYKLIGLLQKKVDSQGNDKLSDRLIDKALDGKTPPFDK